MSKKNKQLVHLLTEAGEALQADPTAIPWSVYPRPQMKRESFYCLNGEWDFRIYPRPAELPDVLNTDSVRLLNRLSKRQEEVLEFLYQVEVPFDNNLAERDVRMTKTKQKISGCFRTEKGAYYFARIRGFISTCQKQGFKILESIETILRGNTIQFS